MKKYIYSLLCVFLLSSCETVIDSSDWLEHDPKLVVTANLRLTVDSAYVSCRVSRTAGLSEFFDINKTIINYADVSIRNGDKTINVPPVKYFDPSVQNANYMVTFPRGSSDTYLLEVRAEGLVAQGLQIIPKLPLVMDQVSFEKQSSGYLNYQVSYVLSTPVKRVRYEVYFEELNRNGVWRPVISNSLTLIEETWNNPTTGNSLISFSWPGAKGRYTLFAYSPEYSDYVTARDESNNYVSTFEGQTNNPPFNISGDGIGFFWYEVVGTAVEVVP